MNVPSIFSVVKAVLAGDLLFSLVNSPLQRSYPFLGLSALCVVFVTLTPLFFFPDGGGNGLVLGALTTFLVFWGSVLLSFVTVFMFGLGAPATYAQKATFVTLATFSIATLLFDFNLLFGLERVEYIGDDWEPRWLVPIAYTLPYVLFCAVQTERHVRRRFKRALARVRMPAHRVQLVRVQWAMRVKALAAFLVIVGFCATMMNAGVFTEDPGSFRSAVDAVTKALAFKPSDEQ